MLIPGYEDYEPFSVNSGASQGGGMFEGEIAAEKSLHDRPPTLDEVRADIQSHIDECRHNLDKAMNEVVKAKRLRQRQCTIEEKRNRARYWHEELDKWQERMPDAEKYHKAFVEKYYNY